MARVSPGQRTGPKPKRSKPKRGVSPNRPVKVVHEVGPGVKPPKKPGKIFVPGVPHETIEPFMRPEDLMAFAEARGQYEAGLREIDDAYAMAQAESLIEKDNIDKERKLRSRDSRDDFAARGLHQSSVRDADLFDIDATAAL